MSVENFNKHHDCLDTLECVAEDLRILATAFYTVGNEYMYYKLMLIKDSIEKSHKGLSEAFSSQLDEAANGSQLIAYGILATLVSKEDGPVPYK